MAYGQTGSGKTYTMGTADTALAQDQKVHGLRVFLRYLLFVPIVKIDPRADTIHHVQYCAAIHVKNIWAC